METEYKLTKKIWKGVTYDVFKELDLDFISSSGY